MTTLTMLRLMCLLSFAGFGIGFITPTPSKLGSAAVAFGCLMLTILMMTLCLVPTEAGYLR